jgi:hypothetical protein
VLVDPKGDTVIAMLGALLATGAPLEAAMRIANEAAGVVLGSGSAAPRRIAGHDRSVSCGGAPRCGEVRRFCAFGQASAQRLDHRNGERIGSLAGRYGWRNRARRIREHPRKALRDRIRRRRRASSGIA